MTLAATRPRGNRRLKGPQIKGPNSAGRSLTPAPERGCAESQPQPCQIGFRRVVAGWRLLRLVCDTAALPKKVRVSSCAPD